MHVKICGLTTPAALETTILAGANMAGFVFFAKSPRHLRLDQARALAALAAGRITKVALVVDADDAAIAAIVDALQPDMLQLHGHETPARMADIRSRFGLPLMKAYGIAVQSDIERAQVEGAGADMLLFDALPASDASLPGGNGVAFDWHLLAQARFHQPWLLSGGLTPENVNTAHALSGAGGVDVSSGVESAPGVKDLARIAAFVAAVRR